MKQVITSVAILLSTISCSNAQEKVKETNTEKGTKTQMNKDKAKSLLLSLESGDKTPIGYINANQYTQHNLAVADGLAGFGEVVKHAPDGGFKANVIRSFQDNDYVFTHTEYDFFGPKIGFDIFRFEAGKIVEHWDNLIEIAPNNPSGHSQIDGTTQIQDLDKTETNKTLVKNFVSSVLINGKFDQLPNYFSGDRYIQHNPMIADGLSGLQKGLEEMEKKGITMVYKTNHIVLGEGNFVLAVSEGTFAGKPTSFYDLFRIENGKIAEHWDVIETILPTSEHKNSNGKFNFKQNHNR